MNYTLIFVVLLIILNIIGASRRGMAKEISNLLALMVAFFVFSLFIMLFSSFQAGETTNTLYSIILLVILGIVYGLVKVFLKSAKAVSHLPIIHLIDHILGAVVGGLESILIVWIVFSLCHYYYFGPISTIINEDIKQNVFLNTLYQYNFFIRI